MENENKILSTRRERGHVNYNVDQTQSQLLNSKLQKKKIKTAKIPIYHLYKNRDRIIELKQKQINYFLENNKKLPEKFDEDPSIIEGLNDNEINELSELFKTGFPDWEKKEYETFLSKTEELGKEEIEKIALEIPTKTLDQVKEYSNAFWERISEIPDGQKILRNIDKKEKLEKQRELSIKLINKKCENINREYDEIKIAYPNNNHQSEYSFEEDQYLLYITNKCGYGNWDDIIREIKLSEDLMFNYYLKSRNKGEIQKRVDYLVKVLEKEFGHLNFDNSNNNSTINLVKIENSSKKDKEVLSINSERKDDVKNNIDIDKMDIDSERKNNNYNNMDIEFNH